MRKLFKFLIIILSFFYMAGIKAEAVLTTTSQEITAINDLIERGKNLDGQEVTIEGEAIGEPMNRGDYTWVNINDGTNAIGVWLEKNDAKKIMNFGNYNTKGDEVRITGTFYRACKEHGGEADLHNQVITIIKNGNPVKEQISRAKIVSAVILTAIAVIILIISLIWNKKISM